MPKFEPHGYGEGHRRYERAIELRCIDDAKLLDLAQKVRRLSRRVNGERYPDEEERKQLTEVLSNALAQNDKALEAKCGDPATWYARAIIVEGLGRREEALAALDKVTELDTNARGVGGSARVAKARLLKGQGHNQEALEAYDDIVQVSDADIPLQALAYAQKSAVLQELALKAEKEHEKRGASEALGGVGAEATHLWEDSLLALEEALSLRPNYLEAWHDKALGLIALKRYEEALEAYNNSLSVRPYYAILSGGASAALWAMVSLLQNHLERYEEALEACELGQEFVADDGHEYEVWQRKARVLVALGRYEEALEAFDRALEKNPLGSRDPLVWHEKAEVYTNLERYEEALAAYDRSIRLWDRYDAVSYQIHLWSKKGTLLEKLDRHKEAQDAFEKAKNLPSEKAAEWYERARTSAIEGRKSDVLRQLPEAIELSGEFKERARTDSAFEALWDDQDFKRMVT